MPVTLEQARTLDALARGGTLERAAAQLHKGHTAVLYALRGLEQQTGLALLDRSGYRTRLTPAGERVLEQCRRLLEAERELDGLCAELRAGWEPRLRVVFDGVFPAEPFLHLAAELLGERAPTRLEASVAFLTGVEEAFERGPADLMVSILPPRAAGLVARPLPPLRARLVARSDHPLARLPGPLSADDLAGHVLLTVHGSDPRLQLATGQLEARSTVRLSDFGAKKTALLQGLGFGWLPEHLMRAELDVGELVELPLPGGAVHAFEPVLYHRAGQRLGPAARRLLQALEPPSTTVSLVEPRGPSPASGGVSVPARRARRARR